jgi:1-phosphatidylinositol-3-phosphate 5-kinase
VAFCSCRVTSLTSVVTATHLKRLFANQDVFNTLDRNVAGLTVSEVDEKETKAGETDETTPLSTEAATPMPGESPGVSCSSSQVDLVGSEGITPIAGVAQAARNPLSSPPSPGEYDSDSTVGAAPRRSPLASPGMSMDRLESSEMDSDAHAFISRLPRRSKPAPRYVIGSFSLVARANQRSIADLVKRFQESAANHEFEGIEEPPFERPRSSNSLRRLQSRQGDPGASDSDDAKARPRLRRGRTEQPPSRHRDVSRPGLMSDGDRSYAANASRIPSTLGRRLAGGSDTLRPPARTSTAPSPATRSRRPSPEGLDRLPPGPPVRPPGTPGEGKPRLGGKGKMPRAAESHVASRNVTRRAIPGTPGSTRVSSIARHFDRLSREAERERQKRISAVRGKRARPVAVTKAKVQVFNNVRDAFKDEFDTDSSEADNEEDDMGSEDSADSNGEARPRRKSSSPTKQRPESPVKSGKAKESTPTPPMPVSHAPASDSLSVAGNEGAGAEIAASAATSVLSDFKSEMSFTDRLQIELPSFETSAPLPSVPATPQPLTDTADEAKGPNFGQVSQISQMSESEMSSGGERSSILKTLTGLWAFRAGDYTPLEYPL